MRAHASSAKIEVHLAVTFCYDKRLWVTMAPAP